VSFALEFKNTRIFLHLFLRLYPFSSICMFTSLYLNGRSNDESLEGTNTWDPPIDFKQETSQTEDEENEDVGLPPELERLVAHEEQEMGPHQEETELVDLGAGSGKREVKIGTGITAPIHEELITLLRD